MPPSFWPKIDRTEGLKAINQANTLKRRPVLVSEQSKMQNFQMNTVTAMWLNILHHELYYSVDTILREQHEVLVEEGYNIPSVTAGKITGMILEAYNPYELVALLNDPNHSLGEVMADAVFTLADAAA